ncbi:MAG: Flp pilus assembly complex ATPase component TadA, partial [Planctomycetes bacterium]|nr:Flp pilus assembly complex ATPase component TadA [Planctomycetota bacterium]
LINTQYRRHIITLEDPIEYIHATKRSIVHQRGMHYDIRDFASGIVAALREDPDVVVVGELRDQETMKLAVSAAEVGTLIFATMHTSSAASTVERMIDVFPDDEQPQVRAMLSQSLAGVVSQVLLHRLDGERRVPATEVLVATPAVSNLIRESKVPDIYSVIQAGKGLGMHTLDDSLEDLVGRKLVDPEEAYAYAQNKARFEKAMKGAMSLDVPLQNPRPKRAGE